MFDTDGSNVLFPLVEDGTAAFVESVDDLATGLGATSGARFDRERFFKSNAVENVIQELEQIKAESSS